MSESSVPVPGAGEMGGGAQHAWAGGQAEPDPRRWLILVVIGIAQLMVVLDLTVMNLALPSAQKALGFSNVDRQWIVTAYALSFGSLLLFCGRLADIIGRKVMFLTGLTGFAVASAIGGASVNFAMLVTARACQGVFAAMLAPAALSLLTTTFADPKERGKAFGIFGSIAGAGAAVGLLLGGALTSYLSWRWCLYINLVFAGAAIIGGALWLRKQPRTPRRQAGHPRRAAGVQRRVLPGLRVLQRRHARLVDPVDLGLAGGRRGAAGRVRLVAEPRGASAAAAAGGARP